MPNFEIIIIVFAILIGLLAIGDKIKLPNPVLLVVAGLSIGFIPSLPAITLDPEVLFLLFLPPILYDAASHTSWHDFKAEIRPISTLAIALVFFTTTTVAIASYYFIPGFTWAMAFVLGAIVSPPDAVAAKSITKGLGLNRRVITILEGESLVNDASALIAYRFAIAAIGTGGFVLWQAGLNFLVVGAGGILIGAAIGYLFINIHKRVQNNSTISTSLTLLTPFISYLAAERVHVSGVLAVVCTGLMISWRAPEIFSHQTRIRNRAVWETLIFLLNGFVFILIGLQLPTILGDLGDYSIRELITYGLVISGATILIRILWVFGAAYLTIARRRKKNPEKDTENTDTWKNVLIVAWTGTRGVVSLATALALPLTLSNGDSFPQRSLILFLAFIVIFVTLVIQGFSLPLLIKMLKVKRPDQTDEERELRLLLANSVINFIDNELSDPLNEPLKMQIKRRYMEVTDVLSQAPKDKSARQQLYDSPIVAAQKEVNRFQRQLLISFHKEGTFNHALIRRIEQELDHEEFQLRKPVKKNV
jgi:monovalent cation/hydrogen antiporter